MSGNGSNGNTQQDLPENERPQQDYKIAEELSELGKTIGNTIKKAWNSEERHNIESEIRDGLRNFADEVEKAAKDMRESDAGQKVQSGVKQVRDDIESGKVAEEVRRGTVQALQTLRDAIDKMAESFNELDNTPKE